MSKNPNQAKDVNQDSKQHIPPSYGIKHAPIIQNVVNNNYEEFLNNLKNNIANVNIKDCSGQTPLHFAASKLEGTKFIKTLIDNKAEVNAQNMYGLTPLEHAICIKNVEAVSYLLKHRATIYTQDLISDDALDKAYYLHNDEIFKLVSNANQAMYEYLQTKCKSTQENIDKQQAEIIQLTENLNLAQASLHNMMFPNHDMTQYNNISSSSTTNIVGSSLDQAEECVIM